MKRLIITFAAAAAVAAVSVAMPATTLAKHHGRGHHKHGKTHHARMLRFGSLNSSGTTGPSGPSGEGDSGTAGTVQTFTPNSTGGGTLTIKLNDNSTVSGQVTGDTEIECQAPEGATGPSGPQGSTGDDDAGEAPETGDSEDSSQQTQPTTQAHESDFGGSDDQGDDNNDQGSSSACGVNSLTPGTVVKEAELEIGSGGAVFHSIHLIK